MIAVEVGLCSRERVAEVEHLIVPCPTSSCVFPLRLARQAVFAGSLRLFWQFGQFLQESSRFLPGYEFHWKVIRVHLPHLVLATGGKAKVGPVRHPLPG